MTVRGFDVTVFALALFATVCVHAASNVLNDVGDDSGGTDRQNEDRIYPYTGGSRFIQTGIMSANEMARLGISLLALAATLTRVRPDAPATEVALLRPKPAVPEALAPESDREERGRASPVMLFRIVSLPLITPFVSR